MMMTMTIIVRTIVMMNLQNLLEHPSGMVSVCDVVLHIGIFNRRGLNKCFFLLSPLTKIAGWLRHSIIHYTGTPSNR